MKLRGIEPPLVSSLNSKPGAFGQRFDPQFDHAELAMTAGLPDETSFGFRRTPDSFAISHLRLADIGVNFEFAQHPVDNNLQMQLAHAGDQRLRGFPIHAYAERRIFFGQLLQSFAEPLLIDLGLGLDRDLNDRFRETQSPPIRSDARGRIAYRQ